MRHNQPSCACSLASGLRATRPSATTAAASANTSPRRRRPSQDGGEAFFCVVDLHSITTPFDPDVLRESTLSVGAWLHRHRARSAALDSLRAEPRGGPCRGGVAARGRDCLWRAAPHDPVQGEVGGPGLRLGGPVQLPRPDGRRHPALPGRQRAHRRRPAPAPRADAQRRRALQPALRRDVHRAARGLPRTKARGSGTCRSRSG